MDNTRLSLPFHEVKRFSLIKNLKRKISDLQSHITQQNKIIQEFKHNTKTTKINEQEVEIQKLNDENKRLALIIEEMKKKEKSKNPQICLKNKNSPVLLVKEENVEDPSRKHKKNRESFENKYYSLVIENEQLQRELIKFKINETTNKKKKCFDDRNSIILEKKTLEMDRIKQKNMDLEAQLRCSKEKSKNLNEKISQLEVLLENGIRGSKKSSG